MKREQEREIARMARIVRLVQRLSPAGRRWLYERLIAVELREEARP